MSDTIDLIIVSPDEGEAWSLYSPQVPGFTGGADSIEELHAETPGMLRLAGVELPVRVRWHIEHFYTEGDTDYIIRVAQDERSDARQHTAARLKNLMAYPSLERAAMLEGPRTSTGEVLIICVVASDTIHDIAEQLHPAGDVAVLAYSVAEDFVSSTRVANSRELLENARFLDELGLPEDLTVGELMRSAALGHWPRNVLLAA